MNRSTGKHNSLAVLPILLSLTAPGNGAHIAASQNKGLRITPVIILRRGGRKFNKTGDYGNLQTIIS